MKNLIRFRSNEAICRQRAVYDFGHSWRWLAEAEMWANKADDEISLHDAESAFPYLQKPHQTATSSSVNRDGGK